MSVRLVEFGQLRSRRIAALHAYWNDKRGTRAMPARRDIEPAEIKALLPYLELADILRQPFRVYYRVVGTELVHRVGFDYTGAYLDELSFGTDDETAWSRLFEQLCRERAPLCGVSTFPYRPDCTITHEVAIFPLSSDGETVDKILNIEDYLDPPRFGLAPGWHLRGRRRRGE